MARRAGDADLEAERGGDAGDDAEGEILSQQHRALLDVQLDIAGEILRPPRQAFDLRRIESGLGENIDQLDAGRILSCQQLAVERPSNRARTDVRRREANAFFLGERDQLEMEGQAFALLDDLLDRDEPGQNAEPPVIFPGVAHRVVVRGDDECLRAGPPRRKPAGHIADAIDARIEAGLLHPFLKFCRSGAMRRREECAGQSVRRLRERGELVSQRNDALAELACRT